MNISSVQEMGKLETRVFSQTFSLIEQSCLSRRLVWTTGKYYWQQAIDVVSFECAGKYLQVHSETVNSLSPEVVV